MWTRNKTRIVCATLLWLTAAVPPCLFVLHSDTPGRAVLLMNDAWQAAGTVLWIVIGLATLGLLIYPPFVPAVQLGWRNLKARMNVDQGPMHQALTRLAHHENADDHFVVAQVAFRLGDLPRALGHANRAVHLDPQCTKARHLIARIAVKLGHLEEAVQQFEIVVATDPSFGFGNALLGLGTTLEKLGRDQAAAAVLEQHESDSGPNREAFLVRAAIAGRAGDRERQRELLERAAAPPIAGEHVAPEAQLARARARVALARFGRS